MTLDGSQSRRHFVAGALVAGTACLAGCGGPTDEPDGATDDDPNEAEGEDAEGKADDDGDNDAITAPGVPP
jgi:hypothetical protein